MTQWYIIYKKLFGITLTKLSDIFVDFHIFCRKKNFVSWEKSDFRPIFRSLGCYHLSRHAAGGSFNFITILCSLGFADMSLILIYAPRRFTLNFRKWSWFFLVTYNFKISFIWLGQLNWKFRSFIETTNWVYFRD